MKIPIYLILAFTLTFLTSCDCINNFEGYVVTINKKPISNLKVYYLTDGKVKDSTTTGSSGGFIVGNISLVCNSKENDIILIKEGLKPLIINDFLETKKKAFTK